MRIIKPLLIYITWIAFVWLCIAYIASDYQLIFDDIGKRASLLMMGVFVGVFTTYLILEILDETNNP